MKQWIRKDLMMGYFKQFIQLMKRVKKFICESPPGYLEYRKALQSKDKDFNYLENEYFKKYILPRIGGHTLFNKIDSSSINHQELFNRVVLDQIRVNPATGLTMIGSFDAGGNPYGFDTNRPMYNPFNNHSPFNSMNSSSSFNSFDHWK